MRIRMIPIFLLIVLFWGCSKKDDTKKEAPPVDVVLAKAISKTVPYIIGSIGNTEAYSTINIVPQVEGQVLGYYFTDGGNVKKGDLLYTIDPRTYQATLQQDEGLLEQAKASLEYQTQKVERYKGLLPKDYVSILNYQQYESDQKTAEGQVEQYEGSVKEAKVNLGYCTIEAPFNGKCGRHLVDPGNVVRKNQSDPLVVINQITPLYILFTVAEKYLPQILQYQNKSENGLKVDLQVVGEEDRNYESTLDFIDNQVDTKTGTILLRAISRNEEQELWPGQFVHVQVNLYDIPNAILIPEQAIGRDVKGEFVFVAKQDGTVDQRQIKIGQLHGTLRVIYKGISANEEVVIDGTDSLYPGAHYIVKTPEETEKKT